jgi:hypothetical protein
MAPDVAETQYGENPDFYDSFFVPKNARWSYLQDRLNDPAEPYGSTLDKMQKMQGNKRLEAQVSRLGRKGLAPVIPALEGGGIGAGPLADGAG